MKPHLPKALIKETISPLVSWNGISAFLSSWETVEFGPCSPENKIFIAVPIPVICEWQKGTRQFNWEVSTTHDLMHGKNNRWMEGWPVICPKDGIYRSQRNPLWGRCSWNGLWNPPANGKRRTVFIVIINTWQCDPQSIWRNSCSISLQTLSFLKSPWKSLVSSKCSGKFLEREAHTFISRYEDDLM